MNLDIEKVVSEITDQLIKEGVTSPSAMTGGGILSKTALGDALEHSMLHKGVTEEEILNAGEQAKKYAIGGLVVPIWHTEYAKKCLAGSGVRLVSAISFPYGGQSLSCKLQEVSEALDNGVDEIDVVPNFERLQRGHFAEEISELKELIALAKPKMKVKINIEWGYFSDEQKAEILKMAVKLGADFVKVQHFLASGKAQPEEVKFIRSVVGNAIGIKIDGGIKTASFCKELMDAGANRMGLTATFAIMEENKTQ